MRNRIAVIISIACFIFAAPLMAAEVLLGVADASLQDDSDGSQPVAIYIKLDPQSTQTFAEFSTTYVGEMIEIHVEDQLVISARLREPIIKGNLALYVGFEDETADDLLERLKAGVPVRVIATPSGD